jgi:hypothetical protein
MMESQACHPDATKSFQIPSWLMLQSWQRRVIRL